jgi:uncharacterized protein (DUF1800 family)
MKTPAVAVLLCVAAGMGLAGSGAETRAPADAAVVHVLNRVGFGPRPGDVERVRAMGVDKYIEQQLYPERIPNRDLDSRLAGLITLSLSSREIVRRYQLPALEARRSRTQQAANPNQTPEMRPPAGASGGGQAANLPLVELAQHKVLRAVYSERQLEEVLTDFWFNHFNVDARKGPTRFLLTEYEREAIRPHVLGRFRDLLGATAKSPAMLFYLDNWMSADPDAGSSRFRMARPRLGRGRGLLMPPRPAPQPQDRQANARRGLNENYARELMELHTLGVDGGYTQKDVTEVARAFTGWTIVNPRLGGSFRFDPRMHDEGEKIVLEHTIHGGGGMSDGEQVLDILAAHPSTARFIATKLARRFVSDAPPPALVDRMAARFAATGGNLREVMRALLTSPEFASPESHAAKVKTPFEFVVSALRASAAPVADARPLVQALQQLGMPLYQCQPPTGYKDTADAWVNTGALVNRMNFALTLASRGRAPTLDATAAYDVLAGLNVSGATRSTIAQAANEQQALALALGSPEFQQR